MFKLVFSPVLDPAGGTNGTGSADPNASNPGGSTPPASTPPVDNTIVLPDFLKTAELDEEIKKDPIIQGFKTVGDLAKSYYHAKKAIGADKVVVPNKNSKQEDWDSLFNKLGRPESADKYEVKMPEKAAIDESFLNSFKVKAHASGLLPKQVQEIVDFYNASLLEQADNMIKEAELREDGYVKELKQKYGNGFDAKIGYANNVLKEFGGKEFAEHLNSLGLASDPKIVDFLSKIGESLTGDNFTGFKQSSTLSYTKESAQKELDDMRSDMNHPINNPQHASHEAALKQQERLAKIAYS